MRRSKAIEILSDEEVERIMAQASRRGPSGVRNRALIATLFYAGLRVGEAMALAPRDVDLSRGEINVRRGKGAKQRLAVVSEPGRDAIQVWLGLRAELGISSRAPLFCTISRGDQLKPGRPLVEPYIHTMLSRLAEAAGIEKRVHPHGLRHSHAVRLARRGVPTSDIQGQLGHSSLATTSLYLDSVAAVDRAAQIKAAG